MEPNRESDRPEAAPPSKASTGASLPRPELNPLMNPLLGKNMGRWAQVYFTSPPEKREQAVEELLRQLETEAAGGAAQGREAVKAPVQQSPAVRQPAPEMVTIPQMPAKDAGGAPTAGLSVVPRSSTPRMPGIPEDQKLPRAASLESEGVEEAGGSTLECPNCEHKNAAEQRFCGLCGMQLDAIPKKPAQAVAAPQIPNEPRALEREPDWAWLRERSLSHLSSVDVPKSRWRMIAGVAVLIVIVVVGYLIWTRRERGDEVEQETQQPKVESPAGSISIPQQQSSAPPVSTPAVEKPAEARRESGGGSSKNDKIATKPARTSREPINISAPATRVENTAGAAKGTGDEELQTARQFLDGQGVRKDTSTAAQWLWKSVAKQNNEAVLLLSELYVTGTGVPHSCEQARILLVAASKRGSAAAAQKLRTVETSCR